MDILIVIMLWELSLIAAFMFGRKFKPKKKAQASETNISIEEQKALNRLRKEQENFMTYDGTPQDVIND